MMLSGITPPQRVWVDKTEEKGSDVNIAAHLLMDAFKKRFDLAVIVSNDSDLMEPIRMVRRELLLSIGILNPHQHHSCALKPHATFNKRIRQADLAACQVPLMLRDSVGDFHKPPTW